MHNRLSTLNGVAEILLVEDDAGDAFLVQEHIRDQSDGSVSIIHAASLSAALAVVSSATSCILLDLNLPDANGMTALTALVEAAPSVPIVVITGMGERGVGIAALNAGAHDYLEKVELSSSTLWRSIRFAVERRRNVERDRSLLEERLRRDENRRLTRGLLPTPHLRSADLRWSSTYAPASAQALLGGDFIDAIEAPDGSVRVVIGDVSGHGPEEAALGAALRIGWRALVLAGADQVTTLRYVDELFVAERNSPTLFTSLCDVMLEPTHRRMTILSAGHEAPLLIDDDGTRQVQVQPGPIIGLGLGIGTPSPVELRDRWELLLFTDGVFEGHCTSGGRLGIPSFTDLAHQHLAAGLDDDSLPGLLRAVEAENGGPLPDDVAMFLLLRDDGN